MCAFTPHPKIQRYQTLNPLPIPSITLMRDSSSPVFGHLNFKSELIIFYIESSNAILMLLYSTMFGAKGLKLLTINTSEVSENSMTQHSAELHK
jgi:hypothetical protein